MGGPERRIGGAIPLGRGSFSRNPCLSFKKEGDRLRRGGTERSNLFTKERG